MQIRILSEAEDGQVLEVQGVNDYVVFTAIDDMQKEKLTSVFLKRSQLNEIILGLTAARDNERK